MALTPVEIRHMTPSTGFMGYNRAQTDSLLAEVAASFEDVWRERADLSDKVEQLEGDLVRYRELEGLLRTTLVSAERAAAELKEQARREAELILGEAHAEARAVQRQRSGLHWSCCVRSRTDTAQSIRNSRQNKNRQPIRAAVVNQPWRNLFSDFSLHIESEILVSDSRHLASPFGRLPELLFGVVPDVGLENTKSDLRLQ